MAEFFVSPESQQAIERELAQRQQRFASARQQATAVQGERLRYVNEIAPTASNQLKNAYATSGMTDDQLQQLSIREAAQRPADDGGLLGDIGGVLNGIGMAAWNQVVKPVVRGAFTLWDAAQEELVLRPLTSAIMAQDPDRTFRESYNQYGDSALVNIVQGDMATETTNEQGEVVPVEGGSLGQGFFPGGQAQAQSSLERQNLQIDGQTGNLGRAVAHGIFADEGGLFGEMYGPGDSAYDITAGVTQFLGEVALDPVAWATGGASAAIKGAKGVTGGSRTLGSAIRTVSVRNANEVADQVAKAGLVAGDRRNTVLLDQAQRLFKNRKVLDEIAQADEYTIFRRMKMDRLGLGRGDDRMADLIQRLGATSDPSEVSSILIDAAQRGWVRERGFYRGAGRFIPNPKERFRDLRLGKSDSAIGRALEGAPEFRFGGVNPEQVVSVNNKMEAARDVDGLLRLGKVGEQDRAAIVSRVFRAQGNDDMLDIVDESVRAIGRRMEDVGVNPDDVDELLRAHRESINEATGYLLDEAGRPSPPPWKRTKSAPLGDGTEIATDTISAGLIVNLNKKSIPLPDPTDIRRATAKLDGVRRVYQSNGWEMTSAATRGFTRYLFKFPTLFTRLAYPLRNALDNNARTAGAGYTSIFTNPKAFFALGVRDPNKFRDLIMSADEALDVGRGFRTVDGRYGVVDEILGGTDDAGETVRARIRNSDGTEQVVERDLADFRANEVSLVSRTQDDWAKGIGALTNDAAGLWADEGARALGTWRTFYKGNKGDIRAWRSQLGRLANDPIAQRVADSQRWLDRDELIDHIIDEGLVDEVSKLGDDAKQFFFGGRVDGSAPSLFHGSPRPLEGPPSAGRSAGASENLFGPGLYSTSDEMVARSYARKGGSSEGAVYSVSGGADNVLDLESAAPDGVRSILRRLADEAFEEASDGSVNESMWGAVSGLLDDTSASTSDIYRSLTRFIREHGMDPTLSLDEFGEKWARSLRDEGFDALRYQGGKYTGSPEHEAFVLLDTSSVSLGDAGRATSNATRVPDRRAVNEYIDWVEGHIDHLTGGDMRLRQTIATRDLNGINFNDLTKNKRIDQILREQYYDRMPEQVMGDTFINDGPRGKAQWKKAMDSWVDIMASRPENRFTRHPLLAQVFADDLARSMPTLVDDAARARLVQMAADAGFDDRLFPQIAQAAQNAAGSRGVADSVEDVIDAAKFHSSDRMLDIAFDASQRSSFQETFDAMVPFWDAFAEVGRSWGRIMRDNPNVLGRGMQAFQGGRESGFIYTNEMGEEVFAMPGGGALAQMLRMPGARGILEAPVEGLNLVTQGFGPGVGPLVQWAVGAFMPDTPDLQWARDVLTPYGSSVEAPSDLADVSNLINDLTPAWIKKATNAFSDGSIDPTAWNSAVGDQLKVLATSGGYDLTNPDPATQEAEKRRLLADAKKGARWTTYLRAALQMGAPTGPSVEWEIQSDPDGAYHRVATMAGAFYDILQESGGNYALATQTFSELYGVEPFWIAQGKTNEIVEGPRTREGFNWIQRHGDAAERHPDVVGYFVPAEDPTAPPDYGVHRQRLESGQIESLTGEQQLAMANKNKARAIYSVWQERTEGLPSSQRTRMLSTIRDSLNEMFPGWNSDVLGVSSRLGRDEKINRLMTAVQDEALADSPVTEPLSVYLSKRQQAMSILAQREAAGRPKTLGAEANADLRQWLNNIGQELSTRSPHFQGVWQNLLSSEVDA